MGLICILDFGCSDWPQGPMARNSLMSDCSEGYTAKR